MAKGSTRPSVDMGSSGQSHDHLHGDNAFDGDMEKRYVEEQDPDHHSEEVDDHEYLSGLRLILLLSALVMAVFLMLLDASIVATASTHPQY